MDKMLWLVLDTIRETCERKDNCLGCPCADEYTSPRGKGYYCTIANIPSHWQTDIIRNNLEKRAESEDKG